MQYMHVTFDPKKIVCRPIKFGSPLNEHDILVFDSHPDHWSNSVTLAIY